MCLFRLFTFFLLVCWLHAFCKISFTHLLSFFSAAAAAAAAVVVVVIDGLMPGSSVTCVPPR